MSNTPAPAAKPKRPSPPKRKTAKSTATSTLPQKAVPSAPTSVPLFVDTRSRAKIQVNEAGSRPSTSRKKTVHAGSLSSERLLDPPGVVLIEPRKARPLATPVPLAARLPSGTKSPAPEPRAAELPKETVSPEVHESVSETSRARRAQPQTRIPQRLFAPLPESDVPSFEISFDEPQDESKDEPVRSPLRVSKLRKADTDTTPSPELAALPTSLKAMHWTPPGSAPNLAERLAINLAARDAPAGVAAALAEASSSELPPTPKAPEILTPPVAEFYEQRTERQVPPQAYEPALKNTAPPELIRRAPERLAPTPVLTPRGPSPLVTARNALIGFALSFIEQTHTHVFGPVGHVWRHKGEFLSALLHIFAPLALALSLAYLNTYTQAIFLEGGWRQNLFKLVWLYMICLFMWTIIYIAVARLSHSLWGDWKGWERVGRGFMSPNNRDE